MESWRYVFREKFTFEQDGKRFFKTRSPEEEVALIANLEKFIEGLVK